MTSWVLTEEVAYRQLEKERIDSGLSREEAEESITEQDIQTRVERLEFSGALWTHHRWSDPMVRGMFNGLAYRSILEERMNSGLTEIEAMESITNEQVKEIVTVLENEEKERRAREQPTERQILRRDRARTAGVYVFWAFMALIPCSVVTGAFYTWWPYPHVVTGWPVVLLAVMGQLSLFFVIRRLWSKYRKR